jgi:trehalose 6-phosphate phosphatase
MSATLKADQEPSQSLLRRMVDVLGHRPAALITDIDGTLSRIVSHPADATVEPGIAESLEKLGGALDLVAVVTGRDEAVARAMVGAEGISYVGNYGLVEGARQGLDHEMLEAREEAKGLLSAFPCVELETKGTGFSMHYRNCDDPDSVRLGLMDALAPISTKASARLVEGKKVIEMVPGGLPTKRNAVLHLLERAPFKGVVYMGDDLSDVVVFEELNRLRASGELDTLCIAVVDRETDEAVRATADQRVAGVEEVAALLRSLAEGLAQSEGSVR